MTHNLPASIESATSALGALADHTTEIADVLAMAFGLPFAQVAPADSRYGTVTANVERLAGSLDAIAKTAEAASSRLLGLARPVQLDPRPEPCQCQPAAETLTVPPEVADDADDGGFPLHEEYADELTARKEAREEKTTDDAQKKTGDEHISGESLIFRSPVTPRTEPQGGGTEPTIDRPRRRGKPARK